MQSIFFYTRLRRYNNFAIYKLSPLFRFLCGRNKPKNPAQHLFPGLLLNQADVIFDEDASKQCNVRWVN